MIEGNLSIDKDTFLVLVRSIRCVSLIGNPVRIGSGPAAVIGDEICDIPLPG
jgi:UDP-3-O-[3-hydroxymyristoyl] glucosamine N-acyltransferase